jgi:hypothetical protein
MSASFTTIQQLAADVAFLAVGATVGRNKFRGEHPGVGRRGQIGPYGETRHVPGKTLTAFTVNYAPAASHAGIITPEPSSSTCFRARPNLRIPQPSPSRSTRPARREGGESQMFPLRVR